MKIAYILPLLSTFLCFAMEKESPLIPSSLNEQEKHVLAEILFNRYKVTEAFAGLIAQNYYLNQPHNTVDQTFERDRWPNEITTRCSTLEQLENEASELVKAFLKQFDTLCLAATKDYSYQAIIPLLRVYHFNTRQWDTHLRTFITYYKDIRALATNLKQEFAISNRGKRKFLSNLKRTVDILNEVASIDPCATLEKALTNHYVNVGTKENLDTALSMTKTQRVHLEGDKSVFEQFDTYYKDRKNTSATEKDIQYYAQLCFLRETQKTLESQLCNLIDQVEPFKALLSTIDTLSPAQCLTPSPLPLLNNTLYTIHQRNTLNSLYPLYPLRMLMQFSEPQKAACAQTIKDHLTIARNFCYLNSLYTTIETAWPQLPLHALEQKLTKLLRTLQVEKEANKLSSKPQSTQKLEQECQTLTRFIIQARKNIWNYVKERICKQLWQEIQEVSTRLAAPPPQTAFLLDCYKVLEQPLRGHNHEAHAHSLVKEWEAIFKDKIDLIIILDFNVCPYIAHMYTALSGQEFPLTLYPPQEKLKQSILSVEKVMERQIQAFANQSKEEKHPEISHTDVFLTSSLPFSISDSISEEDKEETTQASQSQESLPLIKHHILSWHEHMQLKEQTQKRFIPVVSVLYESDEKVVLRNWRGYSSSDNVTLTLYKIPQTERNHQACTIIINPYILKKYRDALESKWDIYHSFSAEIERNFLLSSALFIQADSPLAQQIGLKSLDKSNYALCIRACIEQTKGYIVYLVNKKTKECFHRFFHPDNT